MEHTALTANLPTAAANADFQRLIHAFDLFNQASDSLQQSYQELQAEAHRLSAELTNTNAELERSLLEKDSYKNYLKNILESLSNGVMVVSHEERVTICNPSAAKLLGLPQEMARNAKTYGELPLPQALQRLIDNGLNSDQHPGEDLELQIRSTEGLSRHLMVSFSHVMDQQCRRSGVTVILKDVTRLKELEVQTQRAQQLQAMGEMAVQLAHEIRNPLGSIELFASLLGNELQASPEYKGWADQIITGVKFLNNIVTNMLTFSRSSRPQFKEFDLQQLVRETLAFIEPILQQRNILIEPPTRDSVWIQGDSEMLRQMMMNLFMNALQAMPERGRLSVRIHSDDDSGVTIEVEDTGIGIPAENVGRIFDPFFTTHEKGTGLGLSLVHQIVDKHQGKISAQSDFGKGTRFTITLPLRGEQARAGMAL